MDEPSNVWDAGDMGCGELLLELKFKMAELAAGQCLKVMVRDPGAPEEMPAWCRLTGHCLKKQEHPVYWIEKSGKTD